MALAFSVELACRGHEFENFELDSSENKENRWSLDSKKMWCGKQSKVVNGKMELNQKKKNLISFYVWVVCYSKREDLTNLLNNIEKSLKPGGFF